MTKVPPMPTADNHDKAYAVARNTLRFIPVYGEAIAQVFEAVVAAPLEKRKEAWLQILAQTINDVCDRVEGITVDALANDPAFLSTVSAISAIALRNHQHEKLEALRNAVAQAALGVVPDYDERAMLLHIIDRLTPLHISVLRFFHEPRADETIVRRFHNSIGGVGMVMEAAVPVLQGRQELHDLIWNELIAAGLIGNASFGMTMSGGGLLTKRTTALGDKLMLFISSPEFLKA